jgi:hypothetical protein
MGMAIVVGDDVTDSGFSSFLIAGQISRVSLSHVEYPNA